MTPRKNQTELVRHDGVLCATFVNTGNPKRKPISTYADLLAWGQRHRVLAAAEAQRLTRLAGERTADAEAVGRRAGELRALVERILLALSKRRTPADADMETLNDALSEVMANRRLVPAESGFRWAWGDRGGDDLDRVLWHVLLSTADLLSSKFHRKVCRCAGEGCGLILVDRSQGSPRKWCRRCGTLARSRKHYHTTVKPRKARSKARVRRQLAEERRQRLASRGEEESPRPAGPGPSNRQVF